MSKALITAVALVAISPIVSAQSSLSVDPLATRRGWEIAGQLSDYRDEETTPGVKIEWPRVGITGAHTYTRATQWFFKLDRRYSYGSLKYEGSGTMDSVPDSIHEVRAVFGKDFFPGRGVSLSPFAGLGYRYLHDDPSGTTPTGAVAYRRYSRYWYAPIGLTSRINVNGQWAIVPTAEYDYFIEGTQTSQFIDIGAGFGDSINKQSKGYGYRFSMMTENRSWTFGPWMNYLSMEDSDIVPNGFGFQGFEPRGETRKFGLEAKYMF